MQDIVLSLIIAVIWGTFPFMLLSVLQVTSIHITMLLLSFVWFAASCIYNIVLYKGSLLDHLKTIRQDTLFVIIIAGVLGLFLKQLLYLYVIDTTNRLNVSIALMSLSSVVSLFIGIYYKKYNLNVPTIAGVLLVSIGIFMILKYSVKRDAL